MTVLERLGDRRRRSPAATETITREVVRGTERIRGETLAAFLALADEDARPLLDLLDDDVEWTETRGSTVLRRLRGRDAVARLLERLAREGRPLAPRGVRLASGGFVLSFDRPWWADHPRMRALLGGTFVQRLAFGERITRIDSSSLV